MFWILRERLVEKVKKENLNEQTKEDKESG